MREIDCHKLERHGNDTRNYRYSLFECPMCKKLVKRKTKDGLKAKACSHKCSASLMGPRGNYKPFVMISGYKYIYSPEHPNKTNHGYVAEHRLVAEQIIGRYLRADEEIHHINFNKIDNSKENILILSSSEHQKLHSKIKCVKERGKR